MADSLSRRAVLKSTAVAGAAIALPHVSCAAPHPGPDRPNIVFFLGDDWRWDSAGCMGNRVIQTPHIDALASDGVRFTRACVTTSICMVSRASILTGQYMSRHGIEKFNVPLPADALAQTYGAVLRRAGYWTGYLGKYGVGPYPKDRYDWSGRIFEFIHWLNIDGKKVHATEQNTRDAMRFLNERPKDKPFCLTVSWAVPHAVDGNPQQYLYQPQSEKLYQDVDIPVPVTATEEDFRALPPFLATERNEGRVRWKKRFDTPQKYQQYMKAYYRLITEADASVGTVVHELRAQGIYENTLIVFAGDNGYFHGEHGLADKWYPYEESIRVPLVVRDPRLAKKRRGGSNDQIALNIDIPATMIAAGGASLPPRMQGRDFAPLYLLSDPRKWREEFYYEHPVVLGKDQIPRSEAVVRRDIKHTRWPDFDFEELFDLKADPHERKNVATNAAFAGRLDELRKEMAALRAAAR